MYQYVHKPTPHAGFLYDMAGHELDSNYFVGINYQDTINTDFWFKMYEELRRCAFDTTAYLRHDTLYYRTLNHYPDTVSLMVMDYKYYKFHPDALGTGYYFNFDTINNYVTDRYPNAIYPFGAGEDVFAVAPNKLSVSNRQVIYKIDPANILKDVFNHFQYGYSFSVDFGDGTGWHTFPTNTITYHRVIYPSAGNFCMTAVLTDGPPTTPLINPTALSKSVIRILQSYIPTAPDEHIESAGANIDVHYPCAGSGQPFEKTIIYLEGIDPMDFLPGLGTSAAENYASSIQGYGLADLQNFGYTFVVVDWKNSRQPIEANALVLYDLIARLKCRMVENQYSGEFVVIGESMGGLVARYCLTYMETHPTNCQPDKMHNTRLLMTFDSPHKGANVPLAIQHAYRSMVSGAFGISSVTQQAAGLVNNMFLDAAAAKQMLLYHVDTYNPLLLYSPYGPHPMKAVFDAQLAAIGNYPQYCKMVALSNGSLKGLGQTRDWDGGFRRPNDKLLHMNNETWIRVRHPFGELRFKTFGTEIDLRTTPDGAGRIASFEHGHFWVRIRLKLFGIRINSGFNSYVGKYFDGMTLPIDTKPGGVYEYQEVPGKVWSSMKDIIPNLGSRNLIDSSGSGYRLINNTSGGDFGLNVNTRIYSDGFHWNFIPTWSALDYPPNATLDPNIEDEAIGTKMSNTPFDIIIGITENYPLGRRNANMEVANRRHHFIKNDFLMANQDTVYYRDECGDTTFVRALNREVGDDSLFLENRTLPWAARFDAEWHVGVNVRSLHYEYPSTTSLVDKIDGAYSKENIFNIDPTTGFARLAANGSSIDYQAPFTGPYDIRDLGWRKCCNDYNTRQKQTATYRGEVVQRRNDQISVFPNPTSESFVIQLAAQKGEETVVGMYDITGRQVHETKHRHNYTSSGYHLPVSLTNLPTGIYQVVVHIAGKVYRTKISIIN